MSGYSLNIRISPISYTRYHHHILSINIWNFCTVIEVRSLSGNRIYTVEDFPLCEDLFIITKISGRSWDNTCQIYLTHNSWFANIKYVLVEHLNGHAITLQLSIIIYNDNPLFIHLSLLLLFIYLFFIIPHIFCSIKYWTYALRKKDDKNLKHFVAFL